MWRAKELPDELDRMAGQGVDISLLQGCGMHETGCRDFHQMLEGHVPKSRAFQRQGPWEIHHDGEYSALVSKRRIRHCSPSRCNIFHQVPIGARADPLWKKKWRRTEL